MAIRMDIFRWSSVAANYAPILISGRAVHWQCAPAHRIRGGRLRRAWRCRRQSPRATDRRTTAARVARIWQGRSISPPAAAGRAPNNGAKSNELIKAFPIPYHPLISAQARASGNVRRNSSWAETDGQVADILRVVLQFGDAPSAADRPACHFGASRSRSNLESIILAPAVCFAGSLSCSAPQ